MLITKHFVFVHQKKTGGRFIRNLCINHMPADWIVPTDLRDHAPAREIPAQYRDLPVLGYVRNPWDWYVSWYHYVREQEKDSASRPVWTLVFDSGRASFKEAITAACSGVPVAGHPAPPWMERMRDQGMDLYSLWCGQMFRDGFAGTVEVGRFENLREDFIAFLRRHAVPVDDGFNGHVMSRPPDNVSQRDQYPPYYDPELRDLVGATSSIVDEYDYTFDG
ncbi:MAG: hypothetical protein ACRDLQ_11615 [Solirubrobacterales bacterium]